MNTLNKFEKQQGQGLSEYIIIVALIAVAAIGVVGFFGGTISNQIGAMSKEMAGEDSSEEMTAVESSADSASGAAGDKTLSTYGDGN